MSLHSSYISLNDKELLLKEIHHRVKNNLQLISSLLRLQSLDIHDEKVEKHFNEAVDRIRSIALIHEKMYQQNELSKIDLELYLKSLVNDILTSNTSNKLIQIDINSEIESINIKNIVPIALLLNELITNSLKHAFEEQNEGKITIKMKKNGECTNLIYSDNGQWKTPSNSNGFGTKLIETLCIQLDGKYTKDVSNGTTYYFTCALEE